MGHRYGTTPSNYDIERSLDRDEEREPRVALRRVVTDDDRREALALKFGRAFVAHEDQDTATGDRSERS
jgi:hypothetical protein